MKDIVIQIEKSISIPSDQVEWELYTTMRESHRAAAHLTTALKTALKCKDPAEARHIMERVMEKWSHCGAWDTEPRGHSNRALREKWPEYF